MCSSDLRERQANLAALLTPVAKAFSTDVGVEVASDGIQIHGGMGYTWEIPAHYYLKRAWVCENLFGSVEEHADGVAADLDRRL